MFIGVVKAASDFPGKVTFVFVFLIKILLLITETTMPESEIAMSLSFGVPKLNPLPKKFFPNTSEGRAMFVELNDLFCCSG